MTMTDHELIELEELIDQSSFSVIAEEACNRRVLVKRPMWVKKRRTPLKINYYIPFIYKGYTVLITHYSWYGYTYV